ncbi:MAG: thiamine pyrophosphate-dependent enzyme, partial [Candidatus Caldatribacteriota bacterium]|nr:thiamine pyrophosphate-dependent enzyme [Candidatus Caldatribacteriota bacterium]
HVIAQRRNVNILVLDSETYSNTGGQMSKATPLGAIAKFAAGGKRTFKKDLAMMAISYGDVYVARVAMGANDAQVIKAFQEAEAFDGPSIIIAYCHCISHGYNLIHGLEQQKLAVKSGYWPLIRFNPDLAKEGKNPLQLDSKAPSIPLEEYTYNENRYKMLTRTMPEVAKKLLKEAQEGVLERWKLYERLAATYEKK